MDYYYLDGVAPAVVSDTAGYVPGQLLDSNQIHYCQSAPMAFPSTSHPAATTGMEFDRTGEGFLLFSFERKKKTKPANVDCPSSWDHTEGPTGAVDYWQPGPPIYNPRSYSLADVFGPTDTGSASEGTSVTMTSVLNAPEEHARPENEPIELVEERTGEPAASESQDYAISEEELTVPQETSGPAEPGQPATPMVPEQDFGIDPKVLCPLGCNRILEMNLGDVENHVKDVHGDLFAPEHDAIFCPLAGCTIDPFDPLSPEQYYLHLAAHLLRIAGDIVWCDLCNRNIPRELYYTHILFSRRHRERRD